MGEDIRPGTVAYVADHRWHTTTENGYLYVATVPTVRTPDNNVRKGQFIDAWPTLWQTIGAGSIAFAEWQHTGRQVFLVYGRDDRAHELVQSRLKGMARTDPVLRLGWEAFDNTHRVVTSHLDVVAVDGSADGLVYRANERPPYHLYVAGTFHADTALQEIPDA